MILKIYSKALNQVETRAVPRCKSITISQLLKTKATKFKEQAAFYSAHVMA